MSTAARIQILANSTLAGRQIDVVRFVEELLDIAKEIGEIHCCLATDRSLRFGLRDQEAVEVDVDSARGKLRMLCARLSVLCGETSGVLVSPYGGEGTIARPVAALAGNRAAANSHEDTDHWTVRFKNTPDEHEFTLTSA